MMKQTIAWVIGATFQLAAAVPGELDRFFDPEMRAWVAPGHVAVAPDGRAWISGGFDRGDGYSTGELVKLGDNGGVESEPASGYLRKNSNVIGIDGGLFPLFATQPFLLESGDFLLPGESGGWLRMNAAGGVAGMAFPDRQAGERITPQFERDGFLWVIRTTAAGQHLLERRNGANGLTNAVFIQPVDVRGAVPGVGGTLWILAGDDVSWLPWWGGESVETRLMHLDSSGNLIGEAKIFKASRDMRLSAGAGGAFRIEFGPDRLRWMYWPVPSSFDYTLEWYSPEGVFEHRRNFQVGIGDYFTWAESSDGALLATEGKGMLRFYRPGQSNGVPLPGFSRVRSIRALPDGKWLIDGLHRLNADGSVDDTWTAPELSMPAQVTALHAMADGRMLAGGYFAMADGIVRNRLLVFHKNGTIDPTFIPDERIGEWISVTATKDAIHVVTEEPVSYGDAIRSNLVKLGPDGALDESYYPRVPQTEWSIGVSRQTVRNVFRVTALAGGGILAETSSWGGDVLIGNAVRLKSDGTLVSGFMPATGGLGSTVLALGNGGFVSDGVIHQATGRIERDLSKPGILLRPLCELSSGVVFAEARDGKAHRLRLWTRRGWAAWFKAPDLENAHGALATAGEHGMLYVSASFGGSDANVVRLLPNGRLDRSFRSPVFGKRERQFAGEWWTAEETGKVAFDPAEYEIQTPPHSLLWHPATRRLWAGGNFNVVNGEPRDGLARIIGGFAQRR
jgi:hypothetical protein